MKLPEKNRLEAFSDGVFAILITLLVLEIKVPHFQSLDSAGILNGLKDIAPKFIAFIISFLVIAVYWISHHAMFSFMKFVTGKILWLNLLVILSICVLPFTTALIGDYPWSNITVFLYALNILCIGILFAILERMIISSRELHTHPDHNITGKSKRSVVGISLNALACILAFIWLPGTYLILLISRLVFIISQLNIKEK